MSDQPSVFTYQITLRFRKPISGSVLKAHIEAFLLELSTNLTASGGGIVGHIKGLLDTHDCGHLMFSITSLIEGVQSKGDLSGHIKNAEFRLNVILFKVGTGEIESVCMEMLNAVYSNCDNLIQPDS